MNEKILHIIAGLVIALVVALPAYLEKLLDNGDSRVVFVFLKLRHRA